MTNFARVAELLTKASENWTRLNNRPPRLRLHDRQFGWSSRDQLVNSLAFDIPLIAPETMAPNEGGKAALVIALRTGVAPFAQMPRGGPFLDETEIKEIEDWISGGAKADVVPGKVVPGDAIPGQNVPGKTISGKTVAGEDNA